MQYPPVNFNYIGFGGVLKTEDSWVKLKELLYIRVLVENSLTEILQKCDKSDPVLAFLLLVATETDNLFLKIKDVKDISLEDPNFHQVVVGPYV